jgi:iron complex outermembrane receptor protein
MAHHRNWVSVVLLGAVTLAPVAVQAQAGPPRPATAEESAPRVAVTGSYIRRTERQTASPIQVLTASDLKASGYTSLQNVMRDVPANTAGAGASAATGRAGPR